MKCHLYALALICLVIPTVAAKGEGDELLSTNVREPVTVTFSNGESIASFDNFNQFGMIPKKVSNLWGDTLFESDHRGGYYPSIATEWSWSSDYLHCTVKLRRDVMFTNGIPMTARDVKLTYERLASPDLQANYSWHALTGKVDTPDDYTVIINFLRPMVNFYAEAVSVPILCSDSYNADMNNYFKQPVGSGPYRVAHADFINSFLEFERNDDWWGWTTENKSNVDLIKYKKIEDITSRISSLTRGEIDISEHIPMDSIESLENMGVNVYKTPFFQNNFFTVNCSPNSVFSDKRIREALSLCIDRQLLVDSIIGGGSPSNWPMMEGVEGYKRTAGYEYNVEKARTLLRNAGYKGKVINLDIQSTIVSHSVEVAQAIQAMAQDAGFNITITLLDEEAFGATHFSGRYEFTLSTFVYTQGSPIKAIAEILNSNIDIFKTGYKDPLVDGFFNQALQTMDDSRREVLIQKGCQGVMDNFAPLIYLYDEDWADGVSEKVEGFKVYPDMIMELRFLKKN